MKNTRWLLTVSLLLTGSLGSRAATLQLVAGFNFVTCQVNGSGTTIMANPTPPPPTLSFSGNQINNTFFLGTALDGTEILSPNNCPISNFNPPLFIPGSGSFTTSFYDATGNSVGFIGWYDGITANPATVAWAPGEGVIIFSPAPQTLTLSGAAVGAGPPTFVPPASGYCLVGSPTASTINAGYAVPADIISAPLQNGYAIYAYNPLSPSFTLYYYDSNQGGWVPNLPHFTPNYEAVVVGHIPSAVIEGNVHQGANCNNANPALMNWAVQAVSFPNTYFGISDASGHYVIIVPPGNYTVSSYAPPAGWNPICTTSYPLTVSAGNIYAGNDFHVNPTAAGRDLAVDLVSFFPYPLRSPCAGQNMTYEIDFRNAGTLPVNGTKIQLFYPPNQTYVSQSLAAAPAGTTLLAQSPGTATWVHNSPFPAHASGKISFTVTLPATPTSGLIGALAKISFSPGIDTHPADNTSVLIQSITCSHDPNDMQVTPQGCGPQGYIPAGQPLTYLVEFQNTGNAMAYQVVVSNTLDANLDVSTLQVLGSSHPNALQVQGQQLVWTFPNINLPDETDDDLGSHGYVKYQISPLAGAPIGAVITNSAQIFFDLNAPISTVSTTNTLTAGPVPVASFSVNPEVGSDGQTNDFTYTGGTAGAQFLWNFGANATPSTSTDQNPAGVVFASPGDQMVSLQVGLGGCESDPAVQIIYVGAPSLTAGMVDSQLGLSWEGNGFHLQETTNLPPTAPWVATSGSPTQIGSSYSVTLPVDSVATFYRLSQVPP